MLLRTNSISSLMTTLKSYDEAVAQWVSRVISPHIVGVVITSAMAMQYADNPWEAVLWLLGLMPLLVLPPLLYIVWLVRQGILEDIYMPRRETRAGPLMILLVWLSICVALIRYWAAPRIVEAFVITTIVLVAFLSLVTLFWKISFHGATISAAVTATVLVVGASALPSLLLIPLVGWSRIRLARHTPRQVVYGSLAGAVIAVIMVHGILLQLL